MTLNDKDVTSWPMYRRARDGGMGYLAQESSVFRKLSVQNNLLGVMEMLGMNQRRVSLEAALRAPWVAADTAARLAADLSSPAMGPIQ